MTDPLRVEVERSGFVESTHLVDVAVVDPAGNLVAAAGDPEREVALRSCAKPIQARVCLQSGWTPPDARSIAVACASHYGELEHVESVRRTLAAAGLNDEALRCPPDVPLDAEAALAVTERASVYNNCSGKHAAMLATCVEAGWPLQTYCEPDHPLQRRVRELIDGLTGGTRQTLVDGCGVPSFTAPLAAVARAFAAIDDDGPEAGAMRAHPFLVSGTARLDTDLMASTDLLVKSGAEGLVCVAGPGYAIALKVRDGDWPRARGPVTLLVLRWLGVLDDELAPELQRHAEVEVLGGGVEVGRARARGTIEWSG